MDPDDETLDGLARSATHVLRELAEARAELAARKLGCSCRWAPKPGLMPSPECPTHGVEASDLLTLGRSARDAALRVLTTS